MNRFPIPFALLATIAIACADGTLPPRAANDPSNPAAPEAPADGTTALSGPAPDAPSAEPPPSPAHAHHHHAPPAPGSWP